MALQVRSLAALVVAASLLGLAPPGAASSQNDAGTGADAGNTFDAATLVAVPGRYAGGLDRAADDVHDYYRFFVPEGGSVSLTVSFTSNAAVRATVLDPHGVPLDVAYSAYGVAAPDVAGVRLEVASAPFGGFYRLHLEQADGPSWVGAASVGYVLCFRPCGDAGAQDDAGTGGDAGNSLADATPIAAAGRYSGRVAGAGADDDDYYRFHVGSGESVNVEIKDALQTGSLVAGDNARRLSFQLLGPGGALLDTPNTNQGDARLTLLAAPVAGDYYLRVTAEHGFVGSYEVCFLPEFTSCPDFALHAIGTFGGGSPRHANTRVLLVPPTHGDLGNPLGPNVLDYLGATLSGIHRWADAIDAFAADHPQFAYLRQVSAEVVVFDPGNPVDPAGFDIVITFVETSGPMFRGFAGTGVGDPGFVLDQHGVEDVRMSTRHIVLSLFAASPRAGQLVPDYPEWNDLEAVTMHEVAHTWGLGHSRTWLPDTGADLMNSPATFVYGDGSPVGDGGVHTPRQCISSLDLYALAHVYRWLPSGEWQPSGGFIALPSDVPYRLYC